AWPSGRMHDVARGGIAIDPAPPTVRRHPQSVDQHNRRLVVSHRLYCGVPEPIKGANAMSDLPEWARRLDLSPHPEGGWFRETWRSGLTMPQSALPPDYTGPRSAGTAILFLLMPGQQSAW